MDVNSAKRVVSYLLLVSVLLTGIGASIVLFASMETRKQWLVQIVSRVLHRDFSIDGDFRLQFGSTISLVAEQVGLQNAAWASESKMLSVDRIELRLKVHSLFDKNLDYLLRLEAPELMLETNTLGEHNWDLLAGEASPDDPVEFSSGVGWLPTLIYANAVKIQIRDARVDKLDVIEFEKIALGQDERQWQFDVQGKFNNLPMQIDSQLTVGQGADAGRYAIDLQGTLGKLDITVTGQLGGMERSGGSGLDLRWDVYSPTLKFLDTKILAAIPDLGPLQASGRLYRIGEVLAVSDMVAEIDDPALNVKLEGKIGDLLAGDKIALTLEAGSDRLLALLAKLGVEAAYSLPDSLTTGGRLSGGIASLQVADLSGQVRSKGASAEFSGSIENLLTLRGLDINVEGAAKKLSDFRLDLPSQLATLGPLDFAGKFAGDRENLALSNIDFKIQNETERLRVTGAIADLNGLTGVDVEINGVLTDPQKWLDATAKNIVLGDPVSIVVRIAESRQKSQSGLLSIVAKLSTKSVTAEVSGNLDDLAGLDQLHLDFTLKSNLLSDLGALSGLALVDVGPVEIAASLVKRGNGIELRDIRAVVDDSDVQGHLALKSAEPNSGAVPELSGQLQSKVFNLRKLRKRNVQIAIEQGGVSVNKGADSENGGRLFSTQDLPFDWLQSYHIDIGLEIDQFVMAAATLDKLSTRIFLQQGRLELQPFTASINTRPLTLGLRLDASANPAQFALRVAAEEFQLDTLAANDDRVSGGVASLESSLDGSGNSIASIMGNLNGDVRLLVKNLQFSEGMLGVLSKSVLNQLNPMAQQRKISTVECAAAYFNIKDGKATTPRGLAIQLSNVAWLGKGDIDLKTEKIHIALKSKARKGLGISFSQLTNLVLIAGTFSHPRIQLDPEGLVGATANYAAAISTGGATLLLVALWDKSQANAPVCEYVTGEQQDTMFQGRKGLFLQKPRGTTSAEPVVEDDVEDE